MLKNGTPRRWNLFARELEDILAEHGYRLSQLDDHTAIHREKVRRLQQSLVVPKFNTLTPEELDEVAQVFKLTDGELLRLRAAILATAIEATLMDRIDADNALLAAEQIFPIILQSLRDHECELSTAPTGLAKTRNTREAIIMNMPTIPDNERINIALEPILEKIDRATMALHLSIGAEAHTERIEKAYQAREGFDKALKDIESFGKNDNGAKKSLIWRAWCDEARMGLAAAKKRLAMLGISE